MRYNFLNIITLLLISSTSKASHAEDLEIQDIEQGLGVKSTYEEPLYPTDSLLEELLDENKEKSDESASNNIEENIIEENYIEDNIVKNDQDNSLLRMDKAEIIILNKITAKSQKIIFRLGEAKFFGNTSIKLHKCIMSTDPFNANNLMLLSVSDNKIEDENLSIFHGWVFSSNPSLSTVEHPVYEVLPIRCLPE